MIENWLLWLILAGIFAIGEIFTTGFFLSWFAVGSALACITAYLGFSPAWQWGIFLVSASILVIMSRRFADRFTKQQPPGVGADRYVGKTGVVLVRVDNISNEGMVRIGKEEWRADSETGEIIPEGTEVHAVRLDGTHLVVAPIKEDE
ncbi:MAG: NfeD family protein [Theionarchaea archaeon]|nr:NfeD family protein [Theionarchaea archaeon]MBU7036379.1 NfeD family protein [Theionarchaea archaeon]